MDDRMEGIGSDDDQFDERDDNNDQLMDDFDFGNQDDFSMGLGSNQGVPRRNKGNLAAE